LSSKLNIENLTYDAGLKPFKFTLSEASEGVLVLYHAPDGWSDAETTYTRHKTYKSVLRNTSTNELIFYKEGRDFLKNCYENSGIDCDATLTVEKLNKTTNTYESYPAANKFDFSTYQVDEVSVKIQMIDTSFKEKVINRATTEVDIIKRESIGSEHITVDAFAIDEVTIPDTSIDLASQYEWNGYGFPYPNFLHVAPIQFIVPSDFTESRNPLNSPYDAFGACFNNSSKGRILILTGILRYKYTYTNPDISGLTITVFLRVINLAGVYDSSNDVIIKQATYYAGGTFTTSATFNHNITLNIGDSLLILVDQEDSLTASSEIEYITGTDINIDEVYTGTQELDVFAFPYYEAFLRVCQLITDANNPFKSDFFGRTDTPLTTYASDGEIGFLTKGIYFRDASGFVTEPIPLKLSELFESLNGIFRIGLGVEQISGVDKVVIEDLDYFFDSTVVLDISDKLRSENIEKHVIAEMFYKSAEAGYSKYEYDNNNGLYEFNTKNTWATIIKSVFNDFKRIVKYRADGQGI